MALGRSIALPTVALVVGFACAPALEPVGFSSPGRPTAAASSASAPLVPPSAWTETSAIRGWTRANAKRFVSSGHWFGKYEADVLVNDAARATYASVAPGASASVGAKIAKVHLTHEGVLGPVLAMEKEESGWVYVEMDSAMRVRRRGRLSPCVECHAHVLTQDELFGVPTTGK